MASTGTSKAGSLVRLTVWTDSLRLLERVDVMRYSFPPALLLLVCTPITVPLATADEVQLGACDMVLMEEDVGFASETASAAISFNLKKAGYESWIITRNAETNLLQLQGIFAKKDKSNPSFNLPIGSRILFSIQRSFEDNKHCIYFNVTNTGSVTATATGWGANFWDVELSPEGVVVEDEASRVSILTGCCPYP